MAVLRQSKSKRYTMVEEHEDRVLLAERLLPLDPLRAHGIDRLVASAREASLLGLDPSLAQFIPEARLHFARWTA